jgi:hypothetical protein
LGEDEIKVLPQIRGYGTFLLLNHLVSLRDRDELGWQWDRLAAPLLDLAEDQAAALPVRTR